MARSIEDQLAHSLGRRDEASNVALAEKIAKANNSEALEALADLLRSPVSGIRHDAIKVLYEIGDQTGTYHPVYQGVPAIA